MNNDDYGQAEALRYSQRFKLYQAALTGLCSNIELDDDLDALVVSARALDMADAAINRWEKEE